MDSMPKESSEESSIHVVEKSSGAKKSKVGHSSPTKKRKNTKISIVWDHFEKIKDCDPNDPYAKCKYCGSKYACHSKRNGTGSLKHHLEMCKKYPYQRKNDPGQKQLVFKPKKAIDNSKSKHSCETFSLENCRRALAEMIILDELPFRFVENIGFRRFINKSIALFAPNFVLPSQITIARDVLKIYVSEKKRLKDMFKAKRYRVSLATDCWTSEQNINYMVLTAHFIDSDWNLQKRILSFSTIENHRGDTIGKTIEKNLKNWGIDKVMTLTVDNASSNDTTVAYLIKRFSSGLLLKGEFLHVRCCAHILNLIVCDAFKEHYECITKIRNVVRFVRSSPTRAMKFKKCIEIEKITSKNLVCLDVSTRWSSTYMMLEAATKFQNAFERLEDEDSTFMSECQPTRENWENARMLVRFLKVFYNATLKISGSLYTTSNVVFHQISTIQNCIQLNSMDSGNQILCDVAKSMKSKFEKYWGNNEKTNLLLYVAVVLDPRYKLKFLSYCFNNLLEPTSAKSMTDKVEQVLRQLFHAYSSSSSGGSGSGSDITKEKGGAQTMNVDDESETYGFARSFSSVETTTFDRESEIEVYLLETLAKDDSSFDILNWWKQNSHRFEILSAISRDLLAIPISTVASESAFSTGGRVVDSSRSSLAPKTVEALICTQNWLNSNSIDIEFFKLLEEDSTLEEGFRMIIDEEKDVDEIDFSKL